MATVSTMEVTVIPVTRFRQNCSLLRCTSTNAGAIVDPGGDLERIIAAVDETGVRVEKIFITHGHLDHAGATRGLARQLDVPVEGPHVADQFLVEAIPRQAKRYGVEADAFVPDRWLEESDTLTFGAQHLEVLHCPGHTPGHLVFFNRDVSYCLVGDVIFNGSVGRTDLPQGSHDQLVHSIRHKLFPLGDEVTFLPGHGQTSTFGWERLCNPYVNDLMFDDE